MIKTFLTLSAALLCAQGTVLAQSQNNPSKNNTLRQGTVNPLTAGKTTATDSRLIAMTTYVSQNSTLGIEDSARCYYSPGFGYDKVLDEWKFNNAKMWEHNGSSFDETYRITNSFNPNNQVTMTQYETYDGSSWQTEEYTTHTYDAAGNEAGNKDAYYNGSNWDSSRNTFTYNSANKLTMQLMEEYNAGSMQWEGSMRTTTSYNSNGQVTGILNETWNGSQWQNSYRTTNTYVNNLLTEELSETWNSSWQNANKTVYTYTGVLATMQENFYWNGMNSTWDPSRRTTNVYNTGGDLISATTEMYTPGGYENHTRTLTTYNSYHQALVETYQTWNSGASQYELQNGDNEQRYHYEEYTNSVKDSKTAAGSISIYPNPAKGTLHLRTGFAEATAASVMLTDMAGRMVKQLQLPTAKAYSTTIDVSALAPGTYILNLNAGGKLMSQKVVVQ